MEVQGVNISHPSDCRYDESDGPFALAMFSCQCLLIALGLFGNLAIVVVVSSYSAPASAINELIRALAFFDFCYAACVTMFVFYYEYHYIGALGVDYEIVGRLVVIFVPLSYTCQTLSYWTVAAISANRYNAVCRPTESMAANTARRARLTVAAMTVGAVVFSTPSYVEHWAWPGTTSLCYGYVVYVNDTLIQSDAYRYGYGLAASVTADYLGPLCVTAYCSFHIVRTLVRGRRHADAPPGSRRSGGARGQIAERRLSKIMLVTSAVFMVCVWADALDKVLWRLQSDLAPKFYLVQTVFSLTNASTDFLVYAIMNRKFRETLLGLFRRRRRLRQSLSIATIAVGIPMERLSNDSDDLSGAGAAADSATAGRRVDSYCSTARPPYEAPRHCRETLGADGSQTRAPATASDLAAGTGPARRWAREAWKTYTDTRRRLAAMAVVLTVATLGQTAHDDRLARALARVNRTRKLANAVTWSA